VGFSPPFFFAYDVMSHNPIIDRLLSLIEPVCIDAGCELVDVRLVMEHGGWVLRVCIDRPLPEGADLTEVHGARVDLATCEQVSRMLSATLDVDETISQAYSLEVSSPGIDRPLRTAAHFVRYTGAVAKIQMAVPIATASGERRNFRGVLRGVQPSAGAIADQVVIDCDGAAFALLIADIDSARLVPDWDEVMRGRSGVAVPKSETGGKRKRKGRETQATSSRAERGHRGDHQQNGNDSGDENRDEVVRSIDESQDDAHRASLNNSQDVPVPDNR
jgi:ribosome maturation factor RimP